MYILRKRMKIRALASLAQWIEHRSWVQFHSRATNQCNASLTLSLPAPSTLSTLSKKKISGKISNK